MRAVRRIVVPGLFTLLILLPLPLLLVMTLPGGGPAPADAIDGHWCNADGRRFSIEGARIVTQGGAEVTGEYRRHGFSYVVPAAEPGAGGMITLTQRDESTIHLRRGSDPADPAQKAAQTDDQTEAPETWRRCPAAGSRQ